MRETPVSICERNFITQAIKQNRRLDGRKNDEFRNVNIHFGTDWGSVIVTLGETKVLGQVSCELGEPKATRPNEGMMYINVELGQMAAPHFESGRNSELNVQINRTLERTFKDSRCVDLESLCVTAEERVWILRIDLNVLNHAGNLIDCCSIAALTALAHFKRPDVSIIEDEVHIHAAAEKEPIPMVLHHYPVCVSYCTFDEGRIAVADPSAMEQNTAESLMVFGLNSFRELCCLNLGGTTLTSSRLLLQCASKAAIRAKLLVDQIKATLLSDQEVRGGGQNVGYAECLRASKITDLDEQHLAMRLRHFSFENLHEASEYKSETDTAMEEENSDAAVASSGSVQNPNLNSKKKFVEWMPDDDDVDDKIVNMDSDNATVSGDSDSSLSQTVENALKHKNQRNSQPISKQRHQAATRSCSRSEAQQPRNDSDASDSEEEEKMVL